VLLVAASVVMASVNEDVAEERLEDSFTSSDAVKTVSSVNVEMNPKTVIPATIVEHLPSSTEESSEAESSSPIVGDAFETSNFEADVVDAKDSLVDSEGFTEAEVEDAPRFSSQPIRKLKALLEERAAPAAAPSMDANPPTSDKVASANVNPDTLAERVPTPASSKPLLDPEAERASHLYLGYEDPNHLPVGGLKIPKDYSGTIGTEAGNDFSYAKALKRDKLIRSGKKPVVKRCANGCTVSTPVMVGYRGVKEWHSKSTRRVRVPGDQKRLRRIHSDVDTTPGTSWQQKHLDRARSNLRQSSRIINKLRNKRKVYENTALRIPIGRNQV